MARVDNTSSTIATLTKVGDVKPDGSTITIETNGTIHSVDQTPLATALVPGSVRPDGTTTTVSNGVLSAVMPTIDSALSDSSTNAVQNRVIKAALDDKPDSSDIPTKTSDLTNDSGFINNNVANLANYYTKTEVGDFSQLLTTHKDSLVNAINDVASSSGNGDMLKTVYDQNDNGIVDNAEKVNNHTVEKDVPSNAVFTDTIYDDTAIQAAIAAKPDMSDIPTKTSDLTNDSDFIDQTDLNTALNGKVDKVTGKGLSTNDYTTEEKTKLANLVTGGNVPQGGLVGQILQKKTTIDFDAEWVDKPTIDSSLSASSENAVQNKVVKAALDAKADTSNLPTKTSDLTNDSGFITIASVPTKTSDLTNDSGFIVNTVNNLTNYYLKSETYTQAEIIALINAASSGGFIVVQTLPTTDISPLAIYLVPKTTVQTENIYDEYINPTATAGAWEKIGDTQIDLSQYQQKTLASPITVDGTSQTTVEGTLSALNTLAGSEMKKSVYDADNDGIVDNAKKINNHTVESDVPANAVFTDTVYDDTAIQAAVSGKVDKVTGKGLSTNDYTDAEKTKLANLVSGGNVPAGGLTGQILQKKSTTDYDSEWVNQPTIPSKTSDLTNDVGFITDSTNSLTNYYKKTETYTKTEVDNLIPSSITVDSSLSDSSENPVQNKIVKGAIDAKADLTTVGSLSSLTTTDKSSIVNAINEVKSSAGSGDMRKSVYDTNDNGIVDNAEKVNNHTVAIDVPANAVFTDTVYDDTALQATVANKVDKISGKGLSTNDYTTAEKDKLSGLVSSAQVPTGGTVGQILKKVSATNYDVAWGDPTSITVDSAMSTTSTNPLQNKIITEALNNKIQVTTTDPGEGSTLATGVLLVVLEASDT